MKNLTMDNLMESIYDADMNEITLIFADGTQARGTAPEGSFANEDYFDSEENVTAFLSEAEIENKEEEA